MMNSITKKVIAVFLVLCLELFSYQHSVDHQQTRPPKPIAQRNEDEAAFKTSFVDDWREVSGSGGQWHVYSAHFSATPQGHESVTVVTVVAFELRVESMFCHLWNSTNSSSTVEGKITVIPSGRRKFTTAPVWCPIEHLKTGPFQRVSLTLSESTALNFTDALIINGYPKTFSSKKIFQNKNFESKLKNSSSPENISPDVNRHETRAFKKKFENWQHQNESDNLAVCVRATGGAYNNAAKIIEFIELHKILGAEYFFFYNFSIGPDVDEILRFYVRRGDAEVLPFSLPAITIEGIHAYGQMASQADCHLRASRFSLIAMLDLDEAIIPREENNLIAMVNSLEYYAAYLFKNAFFYDFWEDDSTFIAPNLTSETVKMCSSVHHKYVTGSNSSMKHLTPSKCHTHDNCSLVLEDNRNSTKGDSLRPSLCAHELGASLVTLRKTKRAVEHYLARSKFIMRPLHVAIPTVHHVLQFQDDVPENRRALLVPPAVALSHHYRKCEKPNNITICKAKETTTDRTAHRYARELQSAVVNVYLAVCASKVKC